MKTEQPTPTTIDEYIAAFPSDVQAILEQIRATIKVVAPDLEEKVSYQMPTFTLNGKNVVYFAAFKQHIGFYPTPSGITEFEAELAPYHAGKGTAKFPLDEPIPFGLITKIVQFRAKEVMERAAAPKTKRV